MTEWLDLLEEVKAKVEPAQIWSAEESQLHGKGADEKTKRRKSIGIAGKPAKVVRAIFSEHITLMVAMSAAGLVLPSFLIFSGKVQQFEEKGLMF